jgi:phosphoglycolate phosphatase-like HAD superfamily hydrolase
MASFIFDFDGTIADSRDFIIDFIAKEAGRYPLDTVKKHELYGLSVIAVARHLGFKWYQLPKLMLKGRNNMSKIIHHLKPFPGVIEVINKINHEGHQVFIVSSNSVKNIRSFLKHNKIDEEILAVYGGIEVFGKAPIFRNVIKEFNLDINETVCIGDELRDIEAAQSVGLRQVGVTWGFASIEQIRETSPTWIAQMPSELLRILEEI